MVAAAVATPENRDELKKGFSHGGVSPRVGEVVFRRLNGRNLRYTWASQDYLRYSCEDLGQTITFPAEVAPPPDQEPNELTHLSALRRAGELADSGCPEAAGIWLGIANSLKP